MGANMIFVKNWLKSKAFNFLLKDKLSICASNVSYNF